MISLRLLLCGSIPGQTTALLIDNVNVALAWGDPLLSAKLALVVSIHQSQNRLRTG
jgi:hypothetical protein